jgi:hypothetical protein
VRLGSAIATGSAVLLVTAITACGSSGKSSSSSSTGGPSTSGSASTSGADNGVSSKSAEQIVAAAVNAATSLNAVHVAGTVATAAQPVTMDLDLANGKGGRGTMSANGLSFKIVSLGPTAYFSGDATFWRRFGGQAAVQLLQGRWLKAPATGNFGSFAKLTNMKLLFSKLLTGHGALTKGSTSTVDGMNVIAINDTTKGGTLYVATTGQPYPVRISKSGAGGGQLTFDRFNETVSLTPPQNAIDISQLRK